MDGVATVTMSRLLLVDDDTVFRERLARALRSRGFTVQTAESAATALGSLQQEPPDAMVLDLRMPGDSGLALLSQIKPWEMAMRIVVLTGYGSIATAVEAMRLGAAGYLTKPADAEDVISVLEGRTRMPGEQEDIATPSLARAEWEHMQRVLTDCGGNISEAARRLGIHRRSLQRKLQKYPPLS